MAAQSEIGRPDADQFLAEQQLGHMRHRRTTLDSQLAIELKQTDRPGKTYREKQTERPEPARDPEEGESCEQGRQGNGEGS